MNSGIALLRFRRYAICFLFCLILSLLLAGCVGAVDPAQELLVGGGSSPEDVTESFFEDLNAALQDVELVDEDIRRSWTERLASRFAPSERASRRSQLGQMLADYALVRENDDNERYQIEIVYTGVALISRDNDRANVRLVNGKLRLTRYREDASGDAAILSEQERSLSEVIGLHDDVFPVIRVEQRWFLTE